MRRYARNRLSAQARSQGTKVWRGSFGLALVLLTGACASDNLLRDPVPEALVNQAQGASLKGFRLWGDAPPSEYAAAMQERIARLQQRYGISALRGRKVTIQSLSLSGGGDDGAFFAGLLVGWSETGTRPQFD